MLRRKEVIWVGEMYVYKETISWASEIYMRDYKSLITSDVIIEDIYLVNHFG